MPRLTVLRQVCSPLELVWSVVMIFVVRCTHSIHVWFSPIRFPLQWLPQLLVTTPTTTNPPPGGATIPSQLEGNCIRGVAIRKTSQITARDNCSLSLRPLTHIWSCGNKHLSGESHHPGYIWGDVQPYETPCMCAVEMAVTSTRVHCISLTPPHFSGGSC